MKRAAPQQCYSSACRSKPALIVKHELLILIPYTGAAALMGRTLPSITQAFLQEQESFSRFRRALRRTDQQVLDDLFAAAHQHLAAAAYAAHSLPLETFLLAMLMEEHKEIMRLRQIVEDMLETGDKTDT
jgi:hypothetical protein